VRGPQAAALLELLGSRPRVYDCVDIREEVTASLAGGPCRASTGDLVVDPLAAGSYDLAVATNLLVYLDDQELALALANLAQALKPGGCLLHNDSRFAVRHMESVTLGTRNGREQMDRIVVHCKIVSKP
jgi:SAM-dependent methyltransferase